MSKRVTAQDGKIELIVADGVSDIDIGADGSFAGSINLGTKLSFDESTGTLSFPSATSSLTIAGDSGDYITIQQDSVVTTDAATLTIAEPAADYWTITRAGGVSDFIAEGFVDNGTITLSGTASNDGTYTIGEFGVSETVIEVAPFSLLNAAEGPVAATLTQAARNIDINDDALFRLYDRTNTYHHEIKQTQAWLDIRGRDGAGGVYIYGGGTIGIFDWTDGVSNPPVDSDTAYATVTGWSGDQWQLWEVGTYNVSNMDLTVHNYVPGSGVDIDVADITDSFYRRVFFGDYATGAHLYWPTSNAIALSTDAAGVYSPLGSVYLEEKATPGGDTAARGQLWVRNDNPQTLMFTDGDSTDFVVAGGSLTGVSSTGSPLDNQIAVFTDGTTIEGDANFTWTGTTLAIAGAGAQLLLPLENDQATPTLAFGDGNTGFYEQSDNVLAISANGALRYNIDSNSIRSDRTNSAALAWVIPTATVPGFTFVGDLDTGLGYAGADQLSLIAGAKEMLRLVETGTAATDQVIITPGVLGGTANATPTLAFGDGDTGLYEETDDVLGVSIAATRRWIFTGNTFQANATNGPYLENSTPSATNPTIAPNKSDVNTGIGWNAADEISLITGAIEATRFIARAVQTTNATVTEIISVAVPSGEGFGFEIHIIGTENGTGDTVFERVFGAIRNQGGTTALVGSTITDRTDDAGATTWVVSVEADDAGDALTVDVTGEAAHTIDWKVRVELLNV